MSMYVEGEIPTMMYGNNCGCYGGYNNNNGGFGMGEWGGLIGLIVAASIFNGNGIFGGGNRGQAATQADLSAGFANSAMMSDLNDILLQLANGFSGVQQTLCQGFSGLNLGVERGFATTNYNIATNFGQLGSKIDMCCCDIERAIDGVNYNAANNTCQIVQAINCGNQRIIDFLTNEKIDTLNRKLAIAEGQISQANQTATLLNAINRTPVAAYTVPNPYCCYNQCGCGCSGNNFGGFSVQ